MSDMIVIGTLGGSFGVKGEVRLKSFCSDPQAIEMYRPLLLSDGRTIDGLLLTGSVKSGFSARIEGINTKEEADAARGLTISAKRDQLPSLPDDEYYYADLVGLEVFDTGGKRLGLVKTVQNHGATDLLEVQTPASSETIFLPFTLAAIPTVDLKSGRIIADPPEGIFPDA
jgi:16S rRNA processing protein RimM